jgi:acetyl-CoA carboxylase/biotin carboxylase 1
MKMLMPLLTPASGKIHFQLPEGAVLISGDLIARLELDDCNAVTTAQPYPGGFPELGPPLVHSQGVDYRFKEAYSAAKMILEGARLESLQLIPKRASTMLECILLGHPWQRSE